MFSNPENELPLGDKHRIAIYRQEWDTPNPLEAYYDSTSCWTVRTARGLNPIFSAVDDGTEELIRRVTAETESHTYADLQNEIVDALERSEFEFVVMPASLQGYSQGDWLDVILFQERGVEPESATRVLLDHVRLDLEAWFRGDVYVIALEELVTYTAPNGKTIDRWEAVEDVPAVQDNYFHERPDIDDLVNRLEIDLADYGVTKDSRLELVN